jgi:tripartite-type tricarboxylate transporter receptor subunit TctC
MLAILKWLCVAAIAFSAPLYAQPDSYPARPIKLIVPFAAGGVVDIVARPIAAKLAQELGQPVVVENKVGAGGRIGTSEVLRAPADGYTLLLSGSPLTIDPSVYIAAKWDAAKDFEPVALLGEIPNTIVVSERSEFKTLPQVIDAAKAKPGAYNFSTLGAGTVTSLAMEMLQQASGAKLTAVPYQGNPAAQLALLRGDIQVMATSIALVNKTPRGGGIRPLAVTSSHRLQSMPDVPTVAELGFPGYEAVTWYGVFSPRGTPTPVVERLNAAISAGLQDAQVRKAVTALGMEIKTMKPAEFRTYLEADRRRWAHVLQAAGIEPQ